MRKRILRQLRGTSALLVVAYVCSVRAAPRNDHMVWRRLPSTARRTAGRRLLDAVTACATPRAARRRLAARRTAGAWMWTSAATESAATARAAPRARLTGAHARTGSEWLLTPSGRSGVCPASVKCGDGTCHRGESCVTCPQDWCGPARAQESWWCALTRVVGTSQRRLPGSVRKPGVADAPPVLLLDSAPLSVLACVCARAFVRTRVVVVAPMAVDRGPPRQKCEAAESCLSCPFDVSAPHAPV